MPKKTTKRLGRGLNAIIKPEIDKKSIPMSGSVLSSPNERDKIKEIIEEVKENPRITLWSAKSAAVLRYLKKTQPEFSISREASKLIENAIKEKYPEIWNLFHSL